MDTSSSGTQDTGWRILRAMGPPLLLFLFTTIAVLTGCDRSEAPRAYIARVGDAYLMQQEIEAALTTTPPYQDSLSAYEQYISRWVTDQLLVQEARRRNLARDPDVVRRLEENEKSVLISKLLDQVYELAPEPPASDVRAYYEHNGDRLRLREPYLRVRYFGASDSTTAARVRSEMQSATRNPDANADSLWNDLVRRWADDPETCMSVSANYFPLSQIFSTRPVLRSTVMSLRPGAYSQIIFENQMYHLVQFVERVPEGTSPELTWIEPEIRQRLLIQSRKQMYADQVERLRNEALAREALEIRGQ
jgi:hypothetical protein